MAEEMDLSSDFMTLVDDEGTEHMFEVLDAIETDDGRYLAMIPHFDKAEEMLEDNAELVIMKVQTDEEGEFLEAIEDEGEFNTVSALFTERLEDEFDFEDDADLTIEDGEAPENEGLDS